MWISYSDSEVNKYHPICEKALNNALKNLKLSKSYRVLHHCKTRSIEMDFVIENIKTGKYLCVIEVKRTPSDVRGLRSQIQAMSYVQENGNNKTEKPFYILTNLEYAIPFRFDVARPSVVQQILNPGLTHIGDFNEDKDIFLDKLTEFFKENISNFIANNYNYLETLSQFKEYIEGVKNDPLYWKSYLSIFLYEYIRGSLKFSNRNELKDIQFFSNDIARICAEGSRINFKGIFGAPSKEYAKNISKVDVEALNDIYKLGFKNSSGDSIADLLHLIVSKDHEIEGEVSTDIELGKVAAQIAYSINGDLLPNEYICDPAAGSGGLLSSALKVFKANSNQVIANDCNPRLLELLSLRLGLEFPNTINNTNSPYITNNNIENLDRTYFENVKVLVLNPPFVAGIRSVDRKRSIYEAIKKLSLEKPISDFGLMPLEVPFLEIVTHLVRPGTTIACIFPKTLLVGRSKESEIIRKLILKNLGLKVIFNYPGSSVFKNVTKDTCILVGKAMQPQESVLIVNTYTDIPDLNMKNFDDILNSQLSDKFDGVIPGIEAKLVLTSSLEKQAHDGWRDLNSEMVDSIDFVNENFNQSPKLIQLKQFNVQIIRGKVGNSGASNLLFISSNENFYHDMLDYKPILSEGLRNARLDCFLLNEGDAKFFNIHDNTDALVKNIVDSYILLPQDDHKQSKKIKTQDELIGILGREAKNVTSNTSILIPRNLRKYGKVYLTEKNMFVSTNFFILSLTNYNDALLISTWMTTIFYQLICEVSSKDQEGTRKMEGSDIELTLIPVINSVDSDVLDSLNRIKDKIEFLDLKNPEIREVDRIWANFLFDSNDVEKIMNESVRFLAYLAHKRANR